jgi:AraC-like DNA-binding protein
VSLRWVFPYLRLTGSHPDDIEAFKREGITLADFANPDTRIRHRVAMEQLGRAVERTGNPCLGLHAGERVEPGDFDVLEYAARSCPTLREASHCANRYMYLMHTALEGRLIEERERATWQVSTTDDVPQLPAANDFALASACTFARRYTGQRWVLLEVHFRHDQPTDAGEYARIFDEAKIRLGMPHNALVFMPEHLDAPMSHANPGLQAAFEMHAQTLLERLKRREGVGGRVRQLLVQQLPAGDVSMASLARSLGMSVATLRRRLGDEGTTHSELLDEVRRELAAKYLTDMRLAISEVAFLLGFSHVTAFYKAFRRWSHGVTPAEFRAKAQGRVLSA